MTRFSLVFPPQWTSAHPNTGLAVVAAELTEARHEVLFDDLNLEYYDWALEPRVLATTWERAKLQRGGSLLAAKLELLGGGNRDRADLLAARATELDRFLAQGEASFTERRERVARAADALKRPETFYDPVSYATAYARIDEALALHSVAYFPVQITWNNLSTPAVPSALAAMLAFADSPEDNPFYGFMQRQARRLLARQAEVILIDVLAATQLLPAVTLARALRTARAAEPDLRPPLVVFGGNHLARIGDTLTATPTFFTEVAEVVLLSREVGVASALAAAVATDGPREQRLATVPSAVYLGPDGAVTCNDPPRRRHIDETPFPDFSAYPLRRYHAPETVVCALGSRGCYWGQCRFCDTYFGQPDDTMSLERLVEGLRRLRRDFDIRHVEFIDTCIGPERMEAMTKALIAADLGVHWFCNARTERGFTAPLFQQMKAAGCTKVMWGIESGSPRLLQLMRKGVDPEGRLGILRDAATAGLWNFAYIFFGFPTETAAEAEATIDFIAANTDVVHGYGRSVFTVGKHSRIAHELDRFGLTRRKTDAVDFAKDLDVSLSDGPSQDELRALGERCTARAAHAYGGDPLWMHLRLRESLHLYLATRGLEFVRGYRFPVGPRGSFGDSEYAF